MAKAFAAHGAAVTLLDKLLPDAVAPAIDELGARFLELDVTDPQSVDAAVGSLPAIDMAIANAGVHRGARGLNLSDARCESDGVFLFCQALCARRGRAGGCLRRRSARAVSSTGATEAITAF